MSISEPFIRRPIATSLLMAAVILLGGLGYTLLPISALPAVDFPTIQVFAQLPGASPDVMASAVTTPLERQFGQIPGLASMNSVSAFGNTTITLQFVLEREIDAAAEDVQASINAAAGVLPTNLPNPPTYNKVNPADTPILSLAITSDSLPLDKVNDFADTVLAQKLSQVSGVGLVSIQGNQKPAVRVRINPAAISSLGLSLEDVRTVLGEANVNAPKGSFNGKQQSMTIGSNDQIFTAEAYKPIIIAYRNGAPIRLSDVGTVIDSVENDQLAAWVADGKNAYKPAVLLDIQRQPGANIIQTVDRIKALLPQLTATIPPSVKVTVLTDRTETIRASVEDVQFTLLLTVALVVMVIFVFLRKLWATVIPSVALPLSIIGTFGLMKLCGFSLDNLVADGADDLHRLRRGRRHRDDRKHRALHRTGRQPVRRRAQGCQADRFHRHLAQRLADRGVHPAAVHDGHRGPAVPRVRHHAQRGGGRLGGHFADADPDDVRLPPQARGKGGRHRQGQAAQLVLPRDREIFRRDARLLRERVEVGAQTPVHHAARGHRHAGGHDLALHPDSQRPAPSAGHRRHHRRDRRRAEHLVPGDALAPAHGGRPRAAGPGRAERGVVRRGGVGQSDDQHGPPDHRAQAAFRVRKSNAEEIIERLRGKTASSKASRCSTRRCRTSNSTAASAARSTSTSSRPPIPPNSANGPTSSSPRCAPCRSWPTWPATSRRAASSSTSWWTATRRPVTACSRRRWTTRSTTRSVSGRCPSSTPSSTSTG